MESVPNGLPPLDLTLPDLVSLHAASRPASTAFVEQSGELSWIAFDRSVNIVANDLIARGVRKGDRVGFLVRNTSWSYCAIFGAMRAGAIVAPFSTLLAPEPIAALIDDTECKQVFVSAAFEDLCAAALSKLQRVRPDIIYERDGPSTDASVGRPGVQVTGSDLCSIIYSSGTTGTPKGIAHTHRARLTMASVAAFAFRYHSLATTLLSTPPYTNGSWMMLNPSLFVGARIVLMPKFDSGEFRTLSRKLNPTHAFIVPTQFHMLLADQAEDMGYFDSYEFLISAGAPMPAHLKERVVAATGGRKLHELWGLTESMATIIMPQELETMPESVGRPMPLCEYKLIDDDDNELSWPNTGEIVARSAFQMSGYWKRPDANAAVKWSDEQGNVFMRTGDIGEINAQGYLTIRGRKKDMIISGGINVYPVDLEECLRRHADIVDAAVIGVADEKWGERPVAFVIPTEGAQFTSSELMRWANASLSKHQALVDVVITRNDFPRNLLGKVLKSELSVRYFAMRD